MGWDKGTELARVGRKSRDYGMGKGNGNRIRDVKEWDMKEMVIKEKDKTSKDSMELKRMKVREGVEGRDLPLPGKNPVGTQALMNMPIEQYTRTLTRHQTKSSEVSLQNKAHENNDCLERSRMVQQAFLKQYATNRKLQFDRR
jgi:hypothetical protein